MNIFWNSVDPVYLTDSDRVFGETELAAIHTAVQSTVRSFMKLPPAGLETFIANKLNFHFEPAIRHYANMNARRGAPADMTGNIKQAAALTNRNGSLERSSENRRERITHANLQNERIRFMLHFQVSYRIPSPKYGR